ncbi:hypothetical protein DSCO28_71100 [Desulfosarcina ovata subsp. sediminis]|uniref:PEP-CTERM protein-sorting domain-containing protein n=1 Tax=Desulfosarcina ovata subsp. sediminis TaxID=885957 RepID=A0A5K8A2I9_9BACT|nr:hypothetical protein [Desulfosarcina ovata]BBO86544.1 hypothetical protein DSCO28_71100 [Desulfosarcina ovata subsp. sediminis]
MRRKTNSIILAMCFIALMFCCHSAIASPYEDFDFDDITYWVGEGENQAAFVVDWWDGKEPECLVWGYRWDGEATGEDMIVALVGNGTASSGTYAGGFSGADSRLYATLVYYSGLGYALTGLGYDLDNDGFEYDPGAEPGETGYPADIDDHYVEGWYSGYWSYWLSDNDSDWSYSGYGLSNRTLSDGSWDGWSFSNTAAMGAGSAPPTPTAAEAPVPIPGAIWLLGGGLIGIIGMRRKN